MLIVNLTQHAPSSAQVAEGVGPSEQVVKDLLTFDALPSASEIQDRARRLAGHAYYALGGTEVPPQVRPLTLGWAMVGGAPYLMGPLVSELRKVGVEPIFSFTSRQSVEETLPDGSVKKTAVFVHTGWVTAP